MGREIKFRAWHKREQRMYHWGSGVIYIDHKLNIGTVPHPRVLTAETVELMQFTGLKDKNGKEIYEGDRVRVWIKSHSGPMEVQESQIIYDDTRGMWRLKNLVASLDIDMTIALEVIGNIFEHPELIKEARQP